MATVSLARDLNHDRPVALKAQLAATLGPERCLREIRTTAQLQQPHIRTVLDTGEAAGQLWYSMPYVRGQSHPPDAGQDRPAARGAGPLGQQGADVLHVPTLSHERGRAPRRNAEHDTPRADE